MTQKIEIMLVPVLIGNELVAQSCHFKPQTYQVLNSKLKYYFASHCIAMVLVVLLFTDLFL